MDRDSRRRSRSTNLSVREAATDPTKKLSQSDAELQSSKHWTIHQEGFPPGVTVDELKQYRRKRLPNSHKPADNLRPEEGSIKEFKSEYDRRYRTVKPEDLMSHRALAQKKYEEWVAGSDAPVLVPEYNETFKDFPRERPRVRRPEDALKPSNAKMDMTTEKVEKYVPFFSAERAKSLRRRTALQPEGEMITETEFRREFHCHDGVQKATPLRRASQLKLEGLFESLTSEQKEKYVTFLMGQRPGPIKRGTHLNLEGPLDFSTECQSSFIPPGELKRPLCRKRSTSLKLVGEPEFWPEYRQNFVEFPRTRPMVNRPTAQLRTEGELEHNTETRSQFINFSGFNIPSSVKMTSNIRLEGPIEITPEYRDKFIKYGRSKSEIIRKRDNLQLEGNQTFETEKEKYRKDVLQELNGTIHPAGRAAESRLDKLHLEGDLMFETEKEKYRRDILTETNRNINPIMGPARSRPDNLHLEGDITFETEKEKYRRDILTETNRSINPLIERRKNQLDNLHLEGDITFETEKEKYRRDILNETNRNINPIMELARSRPNNLVLQGDLVFNTEKDQYRRDILKELTENPYPPAGRAINRSGNLQLDGNLNFETENEKYRRDILKETNRDINPLKDNPHPQDNLHLTGERQFETEKEKYRTELLKDFDYNSNKRKRSGAKDNLHLEGDISFETEQNQYNASMTEIPDLRTSQRPKDNFDINGNLNNSQAENQRKYRSTLALPLNPEYRSQYVDYPRQRPVIRRPRSNLISTGDMDMMTEKVEKYRAFNSVSKTSPRKRDVCLRPAGGVEGQPEYRSQFIQHPVSLQKASRPNDVMPNQYTSFQVLPQGDQQSMEETSPVHEPQFRLEVEHADRKSEGFHKSPNRVFPPEAVITRPFPSSDKHQAAIEAATRRQQSYEKSSRSPRSDRKDRSFVVLEKANKSDSPIIPKTPPTDFGESSLRNENGTAPLWEPPQWMEPGVV